MIKKIILGCAVTAVVGYLGTVGYVYHYDQQRNPVVASNQIDTLLTRNGCDYCHSNSAKLPFYAELPIAKQIMAQDILSGNQHFNLDATRTALQQKPRYLKSIWPSWKPCCKTRRCHRQCTRWSTGPETSATAIAMNY